MFGAGEVDLGVIMRHFFDRFRWLLRTGEVDFWPKTRQIVGQNYVTFGGRRIQYWGKKTILGTNLGAFLGQEKMILGQNESNNGTKQAEFWGQEELNLGHSQAIFGTKLGDFLEQEK